MTTKEQIDRDKIESTIKEISTYGEGKLSLLGVLDVVVLKGTFLEMGRQYGHLMNDKILAVRDEKIKEYIDPEILGYDTMKQIIGEPFYKSQPKRIKDLYAGISEATGIDVVELSTIDQQFMLVLLARRTGQTAMCTALSTWGSNTKDGTTYTGRNFDFAGYIRDMMPKWGHLVVMNPTGGENSVAGVGICGVDASGMLLVMRAVRLHGQRKTENPLQRTRMYWIGGTVLLMFLVSLVEVLIWASTYLALNAIEGLEKTLYFSMVTFTTLGYGEIVLDEEWRLLASFNAANGIIMFGWTIAVVQRIYFSEHK